MQKCCFCSTPHYPTSKWSTIWTSQTTKVIRLDYIHACDTWQFWVHKQNKDLDCQCILVKKEENKRVIIRERAVKEVGQEGGAELFENDYVFSVNLTQETAIYKIKKTSICQLILLSYEESTHWNEIHLPKHFAASRVIVPTLIPHWLGKII